MISAKKVQKSDVLLTYFSNHNTLEHPVGCARRYG
jgi:hypothetical protein